MSLRSLASFSEIIPVFKSVCFLGVATPFEWYLFVGLGAAFLLAGRSISKYIGIEQIEDEAGMDEVEAGEIP